MKDMILLTLPDGSPILITENGLCIEPEKNTNRCIVTLPHNHRHGKPTLTVLESFQNITDALGGSHLIFPAPMTPARVPVPAPPPWEQSSVPAPWAQTTAVPAPATTAILDDPKPASKAKSKKVGA